MVAITENFAVCTVFTGNDDKALVVAQIDDIDIVLAVAGLGFGYSAQVESYLPFFQMITNIGLLLFACATLFYIVTLPVEFNASWRALKILKGAGVFTDKEELSGAREVLWAAAMTYVASALGAIGNFVRLLLLTQKRRRR